MDDCANCIHKDICFVGRWVLASRADIPNEEEAKEPIVLDGEIKVKRCEFFERK